LQDYPEVDIQVANHRSSSGQNLFFLCGSFVRDFFKQDPNPSSGLDQTRKCLNQSGSVEREQIMRDNWDVKLVMEHHRELIAEAARYRMLKNSSPEKIHAERKSVSYILTNGKNWLDRMMCMVRGRVLSRIFARNQKLSPGTQVNPC
jgi:hypothetical protein